MNLERTEWPPEPAPIQIGVPVAARAIGHRISQPAFGVEVLFNEPWKPCLVVNMWRWRLSVGWLIG